jgi:hypothetical protein
MGYKTHPFFLVATEFVWVFGAWRYRMIYAFHAVKILEKDQQRKGSKIEVSRLKKYHVFWRIEMGVDFVADCFLSMSDKPICLSVCHLRFDLAILVF